MILSRLICCSVQHFEVIYINPGLSVIHEDSMSLAENYSRDAVNMCANEVNMKAQSSSSAEAIDMMSECVLNKLTPRIQVLRDEISFQAEIRSDISLKLENYTCADINLPTTESLENVTWTYGDVKRNIQKLLNRDASKIYTIENFISVDECKAMEEAAKPTLHRATVADGEGGSRVTDSRKAMQAGIAVPWHEEVNGNPIVALSRRVYDFTNTVNGFQLQPDGQEDLMSIQYFGENYENGEQPDRYMPHCDGNCDGSPHVWGNRVATMVMYCEIPEIGGATQFGNAAIHIKPKAGMATFFSYMGSDGNMDNGFTQHSGCPVLKGDKKIVTQWMRYGVDRQNPWNSFNTRKLIFSLFTKLYNKILIQFSLLRSKKWVFNLTMSNDGALYSNILYAIKFKLARNKQYIIYGFWNVQNKNRTKHSRNIQQLSANTN